MIRSQADIKEEIRNSVREDFNDDEMLEFESYIKNGQKQKLCTMIKDELGNKTFMKLSVQIDQIKWDQINENDRLKVMNEIIDAVKEDLYPEEIDELKNLFQNDQIESCKLMLKEQIGNKGYKKIEHLVHQLENMPKKKKGLKVNLNPEDKLKNQIIEKVKEHLEEDDIQQLKEYLRNNEGEQVRLMLHRQLGNKKCKTLEHLIDQIKKKEKKPNAKYLMREQVNNRKGNQKKDKKVQLGLRPPPVNEPKKQIQEDLKKYLARQDLTKLKGLLRLGKKEHIRRLVKDNLGKNGLKPLQHLIDQLEQEKRMPVEGSKFLRKDKGVDLYLLPTTKAKYLQGKTKTALVVGMTGVGKSTFLNSMVNRMMNVEADDPFRYIIVDDGQKDQSQSVTTDVTSYAIPKQGQMKCNIALVDVPGMGDTNGIEKDKQNLKKIRQTLDAEVPELNLILYVFKATDTRITKEVKYVMSQVMGMFGKNVAAHFLFILTFADLETPPILQHLRTSFQGVVKGLDKDDWYLKVNNSALFMKIDPEDPMHTNYFQIGMRCLDKTLKKLNATGTVSTNQSVSVMKKVEEIENLIMALHKQIDINLQQQEQCRRLAKKVATTKADALGKQGYKYITKEIKIQEVQTTNNVTTCLDCKFTCHDDCIYTNSAQKQKCCAMKGGICQACPKNCDWKCHVNAHYIIKRYTQDVEKTNSDLFKQYKVAMNDKYAKEKLLANMVLQYISSVQETENQIHQLKANNQELKKIQLMKVEPTSIIQYLQQLIVSQKVQKKPGYIDRMKQLQQMKSKQEKKKKLLSQVEKNQFSRNQTKKTLLTIIPDTQTRQIVEQEIQKKNKNCQSNQGDTCSIM